MTRTYGDEASKSSRDEMRCEGERKVGEERKGTRRDLTERTMAAWTWAERLGWMIPMPPSEATAAAMADSVTVSIGEVTIGV